MVSVRKFCHIRVEAKEFFATKETTMQGTSEVVDMLRAEGFDVYPGYVQSLIRERVLPAPDKFSGLFIWREPDVDRLRSELRRRDRGPAERVAGGVN